MKDPWTKDETTETQSRPDLGNWNKEVARRDKICRAVELESPEVEQLA